MDYTVIEYWRCPLCLIHLFLYSICRKYAPKRIAWSASAFPSWSDQESDLFFPCHELFCSRICFRILPKCGEHHLVLIKVAKPTAESRWFMQHCSGYKSYTEKQTDRELSLLMMLKHLHTTFFIRQIRNESIFHVTF